MRIGRLDRRVRIEYQKPLQLGDGHLTDNWLTLVEVWAERMSMGGGEQFVAGAEQRVARQTRSYRIRWREGITPRMRLIDDNTVWWIENVADGERRREDLLLTCFADEVVSGDPQEVIP